MLNNEIREIIERSNRKNKQTVSIPFKEKKPDESKSIPVVGEEKEVIKLQPKKEEQD